MRSSSHKTSDQILKQIVEYAQGGHEAEVNRLLGENPEDLNVKEAIQGYARGGYEEQVNRLLGDNPEALNVDEAIQGYLRGGYEEQVNRLLEDNPEDWKFRAAIYGYAKRGYVAAVYRLLGENPEDWKFREAIWGYTIGGHEALVNGLLGENPELWKLRERIFGYSQGGHEALVNGLLGENPELWKLRETIFGYSQGAHKALINALILNISHNLSTSEFREFLREKFVSIPLLFKKNKGLLTVLKENLQIFNPASADSSQAAEEVETKATAKLSESDYKDLIKIISEQMVIDGEGLNLSKYIESLKNFANNHLREMTRLESINQNNKTQDVIVIIQNNINEYLLKAIDVFKLALAGEKTQYERGTLQQVENNGFLGNILAARYAYNQTADEKSMNEYNKVAAKKGRFDSHEV